MTKSSPRCAICGPTSTPGHTIRDHYPMTNPASQQPAPKDYRSYLKAGGNEPFDVWADGRIDELESALTALRDFMWSEGYADQTAVMRQADAALGTPGSTK